MALDAEEWDGLLARQAQPTPFMALGYLQALHRSGSAVPRTGWTPVFFTVRDPSGILQAAAPAYLKSHSYGEYVFDWAWAEAYQRHGLAYYPKLLCAVPFTPVPGTRLMATGEAARSALLAAMQDWAQTQGLSSVHLLFPPAQERANAQAAGWLLRDGIQFHWHNRQPDPWTSFADFLASLTRDKRKKAQQERRRVADAGVHLEVLEGAAIDADHWDFFHRCYLNTYQEHQSSPYLTRAFFDALAQAQPAHWLMFIAWRGGQRIASSLLAIDRASGRAWGRYWGALEPVDCLHFEACYHRPIEWCIEQGFQHFEGGAQGEHKMARGLLPEPTGSAHWLVHPAFSEAVARFLARESQGVQAWEDELLGRSPFKRTEPAPSEEGPAPSDA